MFIYNLKVNGGLALKIIIVILSIFMAVVFGFSIYKIFFTSGKFLINDKIEKQDITEIKTENYTNILKAVHDNPDSYIGMITPYAWMFLDSYKDLRKYLIYNLPISSLIQLEFNAFEVAEPHETTVNKPNAAKIPFKKFFLFILLSLFLFFAY